MKSKKSILGVVLTVVLLASLALSMAPVAAAVGTLSYTTVTTPSGQYKEIGDIDEIAMAPDGTTMFAYDNVAMLLWKSTNAGVTWTSTSIGDGAEKKAIEDAEDAWTWDTSDNASIDSTAGNYKVGAASVKLVVPDALGANSLLAHEAFTTAVDYSAYQAVKLWIKSSVITAAGDLKLLLDDTAASTSPVEAIDIPAIAVADTWYHFTLTLANPATDTAILAVGIRAVTADLGGASGYNVWVDDINATPYDVTGIAISPSYATDTTLVIATEDRVFRSANGGTSFGEVSTATLQTAIGTYANGKRITSIDLATYYTGGQLAILIGTYDTGNDEYGGVYVCRLDTWTWASQAIGNYDVQAVAFSPNHAVDAQILVVAASATNTYLMTKFATNAWAADVLTATIPATTVGAIGDEELTHAVIAFPDDYEWSSNNKVFVGTTSTDADLDDIYRVSGGLPGGSSSATDLNIGGLGTENDVYSIAVSGSYVGAKVVVGLQDSTSVKRTTDPSLSTVTWSSSTKSPIGDAASPDTTVIMAPDFATSNKVYAATDGANSSFSVSTDGGVYFNGISLIEIFDLAKIRYLDSAIVDANTMFLLVHDDADGDAAFDAGETQMVFKTTDGGSIWTRVHFVLSTGANGMKILGVSPKYATDSTIYVAQDDTRLWKSTDGGTRFVGLAAPAAITALTVVDASTYFTGHASGIVYKSGLWNYGTAADTIKSIVVVDANTVFVGNNDGDVYLSKNASATTGVTYSIQGAAEELGDGATITVIVDPAYATNSTIYAVSTNAATIGIMRWVVGTDTVWKEIDGTATSGYLYASLNGSDVAIAADGTLYASLNVADKGIRRSLAPTSSTVSGRGFESMTSLLPTGAKLQNLAYIAGSNVLYAIASNLTSPSTTYPHGYLLLGISDTFAITPTLTAPADGAAVETTTLSLSWEALTAPSGTTITYTYDVAYDSAFANKVVAAATTTGTTVTVTGLTPGTKYYWRVYVASGNPLTTRKASRNFLVTLSTAPQDATLSSPAPGATAVALRPNFQWSPVTNATSYKLQMAASSDFATPLVDTTLTTTVFAYPTDLAYSTVYYWRVKAISASTESAWSVGVFTTLAKPVPVVTPAPAPAAPPIVVKEMPAPIINIPPAPQPTQIIIPPPPPPPAPIAPAYIWAVIIIGAVLVIAVIVLILRTRRTV